MGADDLPRGNLVSALILLENSRTPGGVGACAGCAAGLGAGSGRARAEAGVWGVDLRQVLLRGRFPQATLERTAELEEVRTMLEEQVQEKWTRGRLVRGRSREEGREEGREQGLEHGISQGQRALLRRQAARKFDAEAAERLSELLNGLSNPERLAEIGEWIIECETGTELLERAGKGKPRNGRIAKPGCRGMDDRRRGIFQSWKDLHTGHMSSSCRSVASSALPAFDA